MQDFLEFLITKILPEDAKFEISENMTTEGIIALSVEIGEEYKPRLIGREGRTIKAIQNLVSVLAKDENQRVRVSILD